LSGQVIRDYKNDKLVEDSRPEDFWVFPSNRKYSTHEALMAVYD
jgi:hypothetical protein